MLNSPIKTGIYDITIIGPRFMHVFAKTHNGIENICYTNTAH